jgi:hypothetical protein
MTDTAVPAPGSLEERAISTLLDVVRNAASPDAAQAQVLMLRRLALEGDVVGSRIPAPRNISEIGGYLNLLADLAQPELRSQMLAGILGVSGPNPQLGWFTSQPQLSWVTLPNDRPQGSAQSSIPLAFAVRSDFLGAVQVALKSLRDQGCEVPILTQARPLPPAGPGAQAPSDLLPYLGRTLDLVPSAALADPDADPLALARQGTGAYQVVARMITAGTVAVAPAPWTALKCDATSCTETPAPAAGRAYVPIAPLLAKAGFYAPNPLVTPTSNADRSWSRLVNVTGLVPGLTNLGDELTLLFGSATIAASALATVQGWVWNGTTFAKP